MNRVIKPGEGADEGHSQRLEKVEAQVIDQRHVMTWVVRNKRPVEGTAEGGQIIRSYGWNPETGEYDFDAGAGQHHATRDRVEAFLLNQGEGRLDPNDLEYLRAHMGIAEPAPESTRL